MGLCEHHTAHDEDCGYESADEGHPCSHVKDGEHDDSCYELICGYEEGEPEEWDASDSDAPRLHKHDDSCYELVCHHMDGKHDEACGYEAPTEGHACGFVCEICGKDDAEDGQQDAEDDKKEDKEESCICEIRCTEDSINEDCPVCSAEDAELEKVCLGEASIRRTSRANEDYEVVTSGDTTTYNFKQFTDGKIYVVSF